MASLFHLAPLTPPDGEIVLPARRQGRALIKLMNFNVLRRDIGVAGVRRLVDVLASRLAQTVPEGAYRSPDAT
ncbi:hypothetical protein QP166_03480 [Sphingomonas sp. LR60]|uniref:hypothetical protein n=1 Tax=Sphingomonas sp. LR60 TaxID=3050233 RepID=UPI002FDFF609